MQGNYIINSKVFQYKTNTTTFSTHSNLNVDTDRHLKKTKAYYHTPQLWNDSKQQTMNYFTRLTAFPPNNLTFFRKLIVSLSNSSHNLMSWGVGSLEGVARSSSHCFRISCSSCRTSRFELGIVASFCLSVCLSVEKDGRVRIVCG